MHSVRSPRNSIQKNLSQKLDDLRYRYEFDKTPLTKEIAIMKKNRMAILVVLASLALAAMACNNPLLAANAEGASDFAAEVEAQVQAALAEAEANAELEFVADVEPDAEVVEDEPEVEEVVEETADPEPEPVVTEESEPEIEVCSNRAEFITDVTVEDGADFEPGDVFVKTWRLRNSGSCIWTSSYDLVFDHGDHMGGPATKALPGLVHPGQTVDLSVNLTAPGAEGGYIGYWMLRSNEGQLFGIGANANVAFWVEIEVLEEDGDGPIILELAPIQMFPLFTSSGTGQTLMADTCFDLDAGSMVGCASGSADFRYRIDIVMGGGFPPTMEMVFQILPREDARFSYFGTDLPTGAECQAAGLSGAMFNAQTGVYCYETDAGKYGYLKITGRDLTHMSFDWGTYTFP
jgi:hypothetical protein